MNLSTTIHCLCLLIMCSLATRTIAQNDPAHLSLTTDRVVVFKDGYALVAKTGVATADADGRVFTGQVPEAAILGSFWAVGEGPRILGMRAEWDEKRQLRKTDSPCVTIAELLRANIGKRVTLGLPDKRTVMGSIVEVLDLPRPPAGATTPLSAAFAYAVGPAAGGFEVVLDPSQSPFELLRPGAAERFGLHPSSPLDPSEPATLRRSLSPRGGDFVVIDETETGRLVLPIAQVQTVSGKEVVTKMTREDEIFTRAKRLGFDFGKESAGKAVSLKLFYFTAGMRWIPTYRVTGDLKDNADIALQGELINEIEDFRDVALDLVVGVPNFRFKETVSPLTLERHLRSALRVADAGAGAGRNNFMLNAQYSNSSHQSIRAETAADASGALSLASDLAGAQGEQDLFLYSIRTFSLKRGARATTPLWQNTVPLRHIYTMDIKATRTRGGQTILGYRGSNPPADPSAVTSPLRAAINPVWHQLELTNNSKVPWTTGAALTMRGTLPIAQDLLTYTPAGGRALLPLTVAVDLLGSFDEEETSRTPNALRVEGYDYTLVRKKGALTVSSFRKEKSTLRLSVSVGGKVEQASDDGKSKINDFRADDWIDAGHLHVNNHSDVTWELELEPGQTRTVTYAVSFYVR